MGKAIDCTNDTRPYISKIKAAGVSVVIRYVGSSAWKCIAKPEADALRANHVAIASVYETTVDMMLKGKTAGVNGAKAAMAGIRAAGGPSNAFVYFACDEDTSNTTAVCDYLAGAAQVLGASRCGIYGSGAVVAAALKSGHATKGWRSLSTGWSGYGLRPRGLVLLQYGKKYGSIMPDYDADDTLAADVGQWNYTPPTPPAPPKPFPLGLHTLKHVAALRHHWYSILHSYSVPAGATVTVTRLFGLWALCTYNGHQGWIAISALN